MKLSFSPREQRTLLMLVGLAAITGWAYFLGVVRPLKAEVQKAKQSIQRSLGHLQELEIAAGNVPQLKAQLAQREQALNTLKSQLPPESDVATLVATLTTLADQAQVKIENISPEVLKEPREEKTNPKAPGIKNEYQTAIIQVEGTAGFHQLGTFLNLVEGLNKPIQLGSLQIIDNVKNPKKHRVKLLLRAYVALSEGSSKT